MAWSLLPVTPWENYLRNTSVSRDLKYSSLCDMLHVRFGFLTAGRTISLGIGKHVEENGGVLEHRACDMRGLALRTHSVLSAM